MTTEESTPREAVKYLVKEKSLIGNDIKEAGEEAWYDGLPAENLEPLCDVGRARYQEYLESNKARVAKMMADYPPTTAEEIGALILKAIGGAGQPAAPRIKAARTDAS